MARLKQTSSKKNDTYNRVITHAYLAVPEVGFDPMNELEEYQGEEDLHE